MSVERLEYLRALDIPVWVPRSSPAEATADSPDAGDTAAATVRPRTAPLDDQVVLGPGSSGRLFLCADREFSASPLAADVVRSLPEQPTWAWPAGQDAGQSIEEVVEARLLTSITVFGAEMAEALFGHPVPERLGSASLLVVDAPEILAARGSARRALWQVLRQNGVVGSR